MHKKCFLQHFPTDTVLCSNYILTRSASWQFGSHISAVDDILLCYPYLRRMYLCILWYARKKKQDNMSLLFPEIYFSEGPGCLQKPLPYGSIIEYTYNLFTQDTFIILTLVVKTRYILLLLASIYRMLKSSLPQPPKWDPSE